MKKIILIVAALLLASCAHKPAPLTAHQIYQKMHDASLVILVNGQENGSATFISADGLAASASHCISFRDDKIEVISPIHGRL
ncbi:MAG: hypothetical protein NE330_19110, partial [Lentisphaeraceae bacterium]|nr:hypothetical protein [Lentisphaeraceae bacterium]